MGIAALVIDMAPETPRRLPLSSSSGEEIVTTLASDTARAVYQNLHEAPKPPVAVADGLDLTVQTAHYHIRNLEDVRLIRGIDTQYSEKGIEMIVYEAIPIEVVCLGPETGDSHPSTGTN